MDVKQNSLLAEKIAQERAHQDILLMAHFVCGYPSFAVNEKQIQAIVAGGAEIIEVQFPFSEPVADGIQISHANLQAIANGVRIEQCWQFIHQMSQAFPQVSFVVMTYANIIFQFGWQRFVQTAKECRILGIIVPDLPPAEGQEFLSACAQAQVDPIFIFTPYHGLARLAELSQYCQGFVYAVARKGVTGQSSDFDRRLTDRLQLYRQYTSLPLAVGFGINEASMVQKLIGYADIAVIGTKILDITRTQGPEAITPFLQGLRAR